MEKKELEELIIKDLCGRLPYKVKAAFYLYVIDDWKTTTLRSINPSEGTYRIGNQDYNDFARIKPYLRPMSSMTKEEKNELKELCDITPYYDEEGGFVNIFGLGMFYRDSPSIDVSAIDWLNAHHFDYRGLIEKGLALSAPEGMYNN